jgi:hypothetical protein
MAELTQSPLSQYWRKNKITLFETLPTISVLVNEQKLHVGQSTVAAGPSWGSARELSLSPLTRRGDPPLPGPGEDDVTTPCSRRIAGTTVGSLPRGTGGFNHPRESLNLNTQEVLVAGALSAAAFAGGVGGMDIGAWS